MFELIPNWHPIFVHFTVALTGTALFCFLASFLVNVQTLKQKLNILAYGNLWLAAGITLATIISGWLAYNSVAHDGPSHIAMTDHRNWALVTATLLFVTALWALKPAKAKTGGGILAILLVAVGALLSVTAWKGGENVYRYGLGVASLPQSKGEGHAHEHAAGSDHGQDEIIIVAQENIESAHDHGSHEHKQVAQVATFNDEQKEVAQVMTDYAAAITKLSVDLMETYVITGESFVVIEEAAANFGWDDYKENHLIPELQMVDKLDYELEILRVELSDNHATVTVNYHYSIVAEGEEIEGKGMGTAVLTRTEEGWKLFHFQTS